MFKIISLQTHRRTDGHNETKDQCLQAPVNKVEKHYCTIVVGQFLLQISKNCYISTTTVLQQNVCRTIPSYCAIIVRYIFPISRTIDVRLLNNSYAINGNRALDARFLSR